MKIAPFLVATALANGKRDRFLELVLEDGTVELSKPAQLGDEDGTRKVPPRHPKQRLNKLMEFSDQLLDDHFGFWNRQDKFKKNFQRIGSKMMATFDKCGEYEEPADDTEQSDDGEQTGQDSE